MSHLFTDLNQLADYLDKFAASHPCRSSASASFGQAANIVRDTIFTADKPRVYTITGFSGHWPVGTSAVVSAYTPGHAANLLEQKLEAIGLPQPIDPINFTTWPDGFVGAVILNDGEY